MERLAYVTLTGFLLSFAYALWLNRQLVRQQNRFREFFEDTPLAMIIVNGQYRVLEWNKTAEAMFGWDRFEPHGEEIADLVAADSDRSHFSESLRKGMERGFSRSRYYHPTPHGQPIFCEWQHRLLAREKGGKMLCIAQDMTQSQQTFDELNKRSTALDSAGDAILYTDSQGLIEYANQSFLALGLETPERTYGAHIGTSLFGDRLAFSALHRHFEQTGMWQGNIVKASPRGERVLSVTVTAIHHRGRTISYVANLHDITTIHSHLDLLTQRSQHDPLTGATNRSAMNDRLERAIRRAREEKTLMALFFIDLNEFKEVNDRYGHEAGDRLLSGVATHLRRALRSTDTVSRYGGDEFVVIVEHIQSEEHIQRIHETIASAISEPVVLEGEIALIPKASIGVARYPDDAIDAPELIRAADQAMYVQKKNRGISESEPVLYADNRSR